MTDDVLLEMEYHNDLVGAAYQIDYVGIDTFLRDVLQYCNNPSQEDVINAIINSFVYTDRRVH